MRKKQFQVPCYLRNDAGDSWTGSSGDGRNLEFKTNGQSYDVGSGSAQPVCGSALYGLFKVTGKRRRNLSRPSFGNWRVWLRNAVPGDAE